MLQRFPIVLTQVKAENTSHNLLNIWNETIVETKLFFITSRKTNYNIYTTIMYYLIKLIQI